jgi:hypothetical protein
VHENEWDHINKLINVDYRKLSKQSKSKIICSLYNGGNQKGSSLLYVLVCAGHGLWVAAINFMGITPGRRGQ